jgi:hypothetical protein
MTDIGDAPPKLLARPADAPEPFTHLRGQDVIGSLHSVWAASFGPSSLPGRLRRRTLGVRRERELIGSLIRAVDAVALRCDEIADRLASQEALVEEVVASYGEDMTQLRVALLAMRAALPASEHERDT